MINNIPANDSHVKFGNLYDHLIHNPYSNYGLRHLTVISGYASGAMARHILTNYPDIQLILLIGMAGISGISAADHEVYKNLSITFPHRFECTYLAQSPGVHAKAYSWSHHDRPILGYVGSANLSWSGLYETVEAAVQADASDIIDMYNSLRPLSLSARLPQVANYIRIFTTNRVNAAQIAAAHGAAVTTEVITPQVATVSLLTAEGEIHNKSGLNWGQREGREPNQAYIPLTRDFHAAYPGFFPLNKRRFTVQTDDGQVLECVVAQQGDKAIETPENNSLLGRYIRRRIGVPEGEFVHREDLLAYGRTNVTFTKIDEDLFLMNFSVSTI